MTARIREPLAPDGLARAAGQDLLVIADADGIRVEADETTLAALERAALDDTPLDYVRHWPGTIIDDYWSTERLEDEALCELEDTLARDGLRVVGAIRLTWSLPQRGGARTLVAACTVERAR